MSFRIIFDGVEREVTILARRPELVVSIDGRRLTVQNPGTEGDGRKQLVVGGQNMSISRAQTAAGLVLRNGGRTFSANLLDAGEDGAGAGASGDIRAPMPGVVVAVDLEVGARVAWGDPVLTIESMKLQMVLTAPRAGVIAEILVADGDGFDKDQVLARLADEEEKDA